MSFVQAQHTSMIQKLHSSAKHSKHPLCFVNWWLGEHLTGTAINTKERKHDLIIKVLTVPALLGLSWYKNNQVNLHCVSVMYE